MEKCVGSVQFKIDQKYACSIQLAGAIAFLHAEGDVYSAVCVRACMHGMPTKCMYSLDDIFALFSLARRCVPHGHQTTGVYFEGCLPTF